jgi:thioredoxin-related protein
MRQNLTLLVLLFTASITFPPGLSGLQGGDLESIWTVAEYDPARDPATDLEETTLTAQAVGKRILLEIGGEWCGWCHRLDLYIREHPAISERLLAGFVVMKVNYSRENENEPFLSQYPKIAGYPHLYVLESDGTLLHSQRTDVLEEGGSYNEQTILEFLRAWAPEERLR